jgi:cellulose synthase/poly-beta-1,6-N-acetylglucosamine synthase-like glycosyltransferase
VLALKILFWLCAGALVWTHLGYPLAAALVARVRPRRVRKADGEPPVAVIIAAHNEEDVIARRLENLLELDYPKDRLEIVVASDASTDRTNEIVDEFAARDPRIRLVRCPRGGKVAAQNLAVRLTSGEILAFSDANATWAPEALRKLARNFADPDVAYACGQLRLQAADGTNREGVYWRYELWLRASESSLGSITGGNGSIYAVRRSDYIEVDSRFGHDLSFPYKLAQRGRRAVYDPEAHAFEKPSRDLEDEYRRKVRMFEHGWLMMLTGGFLRGGGPLYLGELVSHRLIRYLSGILHVLLLAVSLALVRQGLVYEIALSAQLAWLALAAAGRLKIPIPGAALAYYYFLVTWATVVSLVRYFRFGVRAVWEKAPGTR